MSVTALARNSPLPTHPRSTGSSTLYIQAKEGAAEALLWPGSVILKYQPSKNLRTLPSQW